jgi:molecular chaperone DnaJ
MAKRDYYEVLGVKKSDDDKTIKKAYKRLAMKHHPDRNANNKEVAEKKFKEIQEAYGVISDPQKRQTYDQFGHDAVNNSASGGNPFGGGGNPFGGGGFEDVFSNFFSGGGQPDNSGDDLQYNLEIDLKQAVFGDTIKIKVPKDENCGTCDGTGAKPGTSVKTCSTCGGAGQVQMQQGFFAVQRPCPKCSGTGKIIESPCPTCYGKGTKRVNKTLSVKIPAGVDNGNRIRLSGEGGAGTHGGASGDLYVEIRVKRHALFDREGQNLYTSVPIDFITATLGGSVEVPTLEGKLKIKIPEGTQSGKSFRLKGKGVPSLRGGGKGDLMVKINIETPVNLNAKQKELLKEFGETCGKKHHPEGNGFFDKVKSFFE